MKHTLGGLTIFVMVIMLVLSGCAGNSSAPVDSDQPADNSQSTESSGSGQASGESSDESAGNSGSGVTLQIATVNNPDMKIMERLSGHFTEETGIGVQFVVLPENELRTKVTEDVALGAGQFDIVTIGTYDTPIWANNGWIESLDPMFAGLSDEQLAAYDLEDIFESMRTALSHDGELYAVPFYGESSMLYYNKEILADAGVEMPLHPTWEEVADIAKAVSDHTGEPGIVLRGLPGWGEVLAPLGTVMNAFGGRWYDEEWNAQVNSDEMVEAVQFYVDLLHDAGQVGATSTGFTEALSLMANGKAAMWYDATVAAGFLNNPNDSSVVGDIGYAFAPSQRKDNTGWLWAWSLAIEGASKHKEEAFEFIRWATSKEYIELVGEEEGWVVAPPGTRQSTYDNPQYKEAAPFADIVLESLQNVDYENQAIDPTPYVGVQYVAIPEFQQLGNEVSQLIASAIAGDMSVQDAMDQAQQLAENVAEQGGYK